MAKKQITVEVSKSAHDLSQALVKVTKAAKDALADGWQPGRDVPAIVMSAVAELGAAASAIPQLPGDMLEDAEAFGRAFANSGFDVWNLFQQPVAPK